MKIFRVTQLSSSPNRRRGRSETDSTSGARRGGRFWGGALCCAFAPLLLAPLLAAGVARGTDDVGGVFLRLPPTFDPNIPIAMVILRDDGGAFVATTNAVSSAVLEAARFFSPPLPLSIPLPTDAQRPGALVSLIQYTDASGGARYFSLRPGFVVRATPLMPLGVGRNGAGRDGSTYQVTGSDRVAADKPTRDVEEAQQVKTVCEPDKSEELSQAIERLSDDQLEQLIAIRTEKRTILERRIRRSLVGERLRVLKLLEVKFGITEPEPLSPELPLNDLLIRLATIRSLTRSDNGS